MYLPNSNNRKVYKTVFFRFIMDIIDYIKRTYTNVNHADKLLPAQREFMRFALTGILPEEKRGLDLQEPQTSREETPKGVLN